MHACDHRLRTGHHDRNRAAPHVARWLVDALRSARVETTYLRVEGALHGVSVLDASMMARVVDFFQTTLGESARRRS